MDNNLNLNFQISLYGTYEKFNEVISKIRARIFYTGINRNNTYITEEFAEKLLKTLPYAPIKGIYDEDKQDYTDHGKRRDIGKIYGVVPAEPNVTWEDFLDDDGVTRKYACCDVLVYTATYKEANEILSKPQSMELYKNSVKGEWEIIENKKVFKFSDACFLGLMALGEDTEPCFEGAAFFSLYTQLKEMADKIDAFTKQNEINKNFGLEGGVNQMNINFKLSDNQKHSAIWSLLNVNYNEESNWEVDYSVCEIYDEYALAYKYSTNEYFRVPYQKNDETDSVSLGEMVRTYIMDVSETELAALKALKVLNNESFEKVDEILTEKDTTIASLTTEKETLETEKATFEQDKIALENEKVTLSNEIENKDTTIGELNSKIENLETGKSALETYKVGVENKEKDIVIEKYSSLLNEEVISKYTEEIGNYTVKDLEKELAYELTLTNPTIFSKGIDTLVPKLDKPKLTGAEKILEKRKRNGGEN